ncbi:MAG: hypothetical protein Q9160_007479 [Pyrenula sp. 1 TL-2023]
MHERGDSRETRSFPLLNNPPPKGKGFMTLPTPNTSAIGWSQSSPVSSSHSSPSRGNHSLDSTSGHSTATSTAGEMGSSDYDSRPRDVSIGSCEAARSKAPSHADEKPPDRFLPDMIEEMDILEIEISVVQEALTMSRIQQGLPIPDRPTTEPIPEDFTDPIIETFKECLNSAHSFVEPPPRKVHKARVDALAGILMKKRTVLWKSNPVDRLVSDADRALIQYEANQVSLPERADVPKKLVDKIRHAANEKRRRQDHGNSIGYGKQIVPQSVLDFADPRTNQEKDKKEIKGKDHEKAVVLSSIVLWNVLLARAVGELDQIVQQQDQHIHHLQRQVAELQLNRNETSRYTTHSQISPTVSDRSDQSTPTFSSQADGDYPFRSLTTGVNYPARTLKRCRDQEP